jgi:hypothetical protein
VRGHAERACGGEREACGEWSRGGTINDLAADAAARGYELTAQLIRDWTEHGLLDYLRKRPAGKGHGSAPAIYSANQRNLLLTLLVHRPRNHIRSLARIPVCIWMYWGDEYVPLRQARRALMTWLGDARASRQAARDAARAILGQVDSPQATPRARRELLDVLTDAGWTGRPDFPRMKRAIRAAFEPGTNHVRRAIGHPAAPFMADSMIGVMKARITAANELMAGRVTDDALIQARDAHVFAYADYAAKQPFLAAVPPGSPQLYEPVTGEDTLANCCGHLLSALGLEIMYPADAERLRQARAFQRKPTAAMVGLVAPTGSALGTAGAAPYRREKWPRYRP